MSRRSEEQHPVEINTELKKKSNKQQQKSLCSAPGENNCDFCLEGISALGEYQQLPYMIIISKLSRASLFWCVYLSDSRQSLQVFCIQNKARHSSAEQIINKLISLLLENVHFFPQSALQYFRKTLISILSMFFFSLPNFLYCYSPDLIDVGILGMWGFFQCFVGFFSLAPI